MISNYELELEKRIERARVIINWRTDNGAFTDDEESNILKFFITEIEKLNLINYELKQDIQKLKYVLEQRG